MQGEKCWWGERKWFETQEKILQNIAVVKMLDPQIEIFCLFNEGSFILQYVLMIFDILTCMYSIQTVQIAGPLLMASGAQRKSDQGIVLDGNQIKPLI